MELITREEFLEQIKKDLQELGSQRKLAEKLEVSEAEISMLLSGKRFPSAKVLRAYNKTSVTAYENLEEK